MKSNALSLPFTGNGLGVCSWSSMYVTRCQWWLSKTSPSWTTLNKELFSSDCAHHFVRDLDTVASFVMCFGVFGRKSSLEVVFSSSAMEVSVSRVGHLATLERSIQDVPGCLGGDSPGLIQTTEFTAASVLLL